MGCMIEINIHEDNFDGLVNMLVTGLIHANKKVVEYYKRDARDLIWNTVQRDVFSGEIRNEPGRISQWDRLKELSDFNQYKLDEYGCEVKV